jgi:hypothetical protein
LPVRTPTAEHPQPLDGLPRSPCTAPGSALFPPPELLPETPASGEAGGAVLPLLPVPLLVEPPLLPPPEPELLLPPLEVLDPPPLLELLLVLDPPPLELLPELELLPLLEPELLLLDPELLELLPPWPISAAPFGVPHPVGPS